MHTASAERIAAMHTAAQREYTAALRAQGLQDAQIKQVMGAAEEIYKGLVKDRPMLKPEEQQAFQTQAMQQAMQWYKSVAPIFGRADQAAAIPAPAAPVFDPKRTKQKYGLDIPGAGG